MEITVSYKGGHSYREIWEPAGDTFCPGCGDCAVWLEQGPGDYYIGPVHLCVACGSSFYLELSSAVDHECAQRLEQIRNGG